MAVGHYEYNRSTPHGQALHESLTQLEEGRDNLLRQIATLIQMKDGGTLGVYAVGKYGFPDTTVANAALAELESAKGALDGIAATLNQLFNKFRNG
jgi:hypothetical protein